MTLPQATPADSELIARVRAGDQTAYEQLFRRYYQELCRYARRLEPTPGCAEEIVQEVFLRVWMYRDRLLEVRVFASYLYAAVRNQAFNWRDRQRSADLWRRAKEAELSDAPVHAAGADEELRSAEVAAAIERAISELPPRCRQAFLLHRREHLTCAEIARVMEIAPKTVEIQIGNALKQLRKSLSEWL